jgi:uncharacterized protein (UPF0335 family)
MSEASVGHNSNLNGTQKKQLAGIVRELEDFERQKREIIASIGGVYKSAKDQGFDTKSVRHLIKLRRMEPEQRDAFENSIDAYKQALGMLADTGLGQAAMQRAGVQA